MDTNSSQIDQLLAQSQALRGQLGQRFANQDLVLQNLPAIPKDTNFFGDVLNSALNQGSFNVLNLAHGNGVGSAIGTGIGGLANAGTMAALLGLTPFAPEVTVPTSLGLAGLLGGASQEARTQFNQSGAITDPGAVLGQGAIEGALNLIPGSKAESLAMRLLKDIPVQAGAGVVGDAASQLMRGQPYNMGETGNAGAMGAGMGILSALLGGPHAITETAPTPVPQLGTQRVAGLLPAPAALDRGFTGTPHEAPLLPGSPKLLTTGADPIATAQNLLQGKDTPLLTGRRVVTTADGRSTFEVEPTPQPGASSPQRLAGDGGVLLKQGTPDIIDLPSHPVAPAPMIHQGEVVPSGPQPNEHGYVAPESINSPVAQTFKNRSSAIRGAKNLGLDKAEIQPVQTGPGEWMIHKLEAPKTTPEPVVGEVTPAPVETPLAPEVSAPTPAQVVAHPQTPETPAASPSPVAPAVPAPVAIPTAQGKPEGIVKALEGLNPKEQSTVHDFNLANAQPGEKIDGLGTFKGTDEDGLPIISRKGGLKRPGESGVAYDEQSLPSLLKQANGILQPGDEQMLQQVMQDIQTGQATHFVGRAKEGNSANFAASADSPSTMAAFGAQKNDRVLGVYFKPSTLHPNGTVKNPAQVVARVVNNLGEQATRIIREDGDPNVGYVRTGSGPRVDMHSPSTVVTAKRSLASDASLQQAAIVRKAAMGTKYAAHPIVQRIDAAIQSNHVQDLQKALRDFDRLPPELQKKLGIDSGCVK